MSNVTGTLPHGLVIGGVTHRTYEVRAGNAGDMFDAEEDAPANKRVSYSAALLARQIVKLGELSGPIDFKLIRKLHPKDLDVLFEAQSKADAAGKEAPSS